MTKLHARLARYGSVEELRCPTEPVANWGRRAGLKSARPVAARQQGNLGNTLTSCVIYRSAQCVSEGSPKVSNVYVWRYPHANVEESLLRLDGLLERQAASLSSSFGRSFAHATKRVGNVLIGQVHQSTSNGVLGRQSWVDHGSCGIAWSGICEDLLGVEMDEVETRKLHETALQYPDRIGRFNGNFLLVSWDGTTESVCITTGDTMSPPLWWTSGRDGWACGSRASPLFELVATQPRFDSASASLFLMSSYHMAGGTFFRGTERIGTRQQVVVRRDREPRPREYLSEPEYLLGDGKRQVDVADAVRACADALLERTGRQLKFSGNPVLELTGGEDSRCIGAAIYRGGGKVTAHTGGGPGSLEVRIARSLAQAFGFEHSVETLEQDRLSVLLAHHDLVRRWLRFSEGLETIRQGLHYDRFFRGPLPVYPEDSQFFNGLQTGLPYGVVPATAGGLFRRLPETLTHHATAKELLAGIVASANDVTTAVFGKDHDDAAWAKMFYWQRRCSIWGFDVMSTKYPVAWYWLPLVDKTLVHRSVQLMRAGAMPRDFIYLITRHNAPHVSSIKYLRDLSRKGVLSRTVAKARRMLRGRVFPSRRTESTMTFDAQYFSISAGRPEMWRRFFETNDRAWKDLIDERFVFDLIERQPESQLLWNLATAELVTQEFF